jgi:hypothetical protein
MTAKYYDIRQRKNKGRKIEYGKPFSVPLDGIVARNVGIPGIPSIESDLSDMPPDVAKEYLKRIGVTGKKADEMIRKHTGKASPVVLEAMEEYYRGKNPVAIIFDTDEPPPAPDHVLAFAGVYDERRKAIKAWHVTNDAARTMAAVEDDVPLIEMGHMHQELGPGLYMSAVPNIWMGRATSKWSFLEHLDDAQRQDLADALGTIVLEQRQTGYITESEYKRANRDLELFVDEANAPCVGQLAGQPYNIAFWKPDFLKPLGIKPGKEPELVEFLVQGIFAGFDDQPREKEIEGLIQDDFDGCFLRGGLMTVAQMVVWRKENIVGMKKARL